MSNWNSIPFNISNFRKKIKSLLLNVLGNEDNYLNVNYLIEYFMKLTWYVVYTREPTTWPANNYLQIMVCSCAMLSNCVWLQIIFCSCLNETTRDRSCVKKGRSLRFAKIFLKKQTRWSNDKTIIELGYRKILWFVSVSQIDYFPKLKAEANKRSARHWQITIFCSTSSNNC